MRCQPSKFLAASALASANCCSSDTNGAAASAVPVVLPLAGLSAVLVPLVGVLVVSDFSAAGSDLAAVSAVLVVSGFCSSIASPGRSQSQTTPTGASFGVQCCTVYNRCNRIALTLDRKSIGARPPQAVHGEIGEPHPYMSLSES